MRLRRFIAGAICPQCRAMDRLFIERDQGVPRRRCVACGYADELPDAAPLEPATRITRRRGDATDTIAPVRILDPAKKPKS
ncbi:MAG: YheV family putative zinc ribbon protein [Pseudomonadales bacterium]